MKTALSWHHGSTPVNQFYVCFSRWVSFHSERKEYWRNELLIEFCCVAHISILNINAANTIKGSDFYNWQIFGIKRDQNLPLIFCYFTAFLLICSSLFLPFHYSWLTQPPLRKKPLIWKLARCTAWAPKPLSSFQEAANSCLSLHFWRTSVGMWV